MVRAIAGSAAVRAAAEVVGWWAVLMGLWLLLISGVDPLEWVVGSCSALIAAFAARAARVAAASGRGTA